MAKRGPKPKDVDLPRLRRHLAAGLTLAEAAKLAGVSIATASRRLAEHGTPVQAAGNPAHQRYPDGVTPDHHDLDEMSTADRLRSRALRAIDRALDGDDPRAIQAAREALAEARREQAIDAYSDAQSRIMRAAVRLAAERLGAAIRAHVDEHDDAELRGAYRRAASLMATPEDVDALHELLQTPERAPILAAAELSDAAA